MNEDKIFRLFSLSKPITSAAAMLLLERGKIELRYPVKWFLPTFENPMVTDESGTYPAKRDITLGDLMNMTSGILYPDGTKAGQEMGSLWGQQTDAWEKGGKLLNTREFALEMGKSRWRSLPVQSGSTALLPMLWALLSRLFRE